LKADWRCARVAAILSSDLLNVRLSDTAEEREAVAALLEANFQRREAAEAELDAAKHALRRLLVRGHTAGMRVSAMASKAQVSRDTAHRILREEAEEGSLMSWPEKQEWATKVVARIPRGDLEQNEFKAFVNMLLLKALGSKPEDVPRSVKGVLELAANGVREVGHKPDFEPRFDPELLTMPWLSL
jgi:hypothetical protein